MTVVKTAGMGIGGAGVIGATGYGAYTLIQPTTVKEKLEQEGYTFLDVEEGNNDGWSAKVSSYSSESDSSKKFSEDIFKDVSEENKKIEKLKDRCKQESGKKLSDPTIDLEKTRRWCAKDKD